MDLAMTRENTAESPVTTACFEWTRIEVGQRFGPIGQRWCVWNKRSTLGLEYVSDGTRARVGYKTGEDYDLVSSLVLTPC
jgi:hypothetical protein